MEAVQAELLARMREAVSEDVGEKRAGIAFSGGVDSALVAKVCSDMGYDITLLTVGFAGSHDIGSAREASRLMKMSHRAYEIPPESFGGMASDILDAVGNRSLSWIENCIAFRYVSELARAEGVPVVVTANGIDELFCGYDAYRREAHKGERAMLDMIDAKVSHEREMMRSVGTSAAGGVRIAQPLLSEGFVEYARGVPLELKITGDGDFTRKHIVRDLARAVGVPEFSAGRRKKALQYGSAIHRNLLRYLKERRRSDASFL